MMLSLGDKVFISDTSEFKHQGYTVDGIRMVGLVTNVNDDYMFPYFVTWPFHYLGVSDPLEAGYHDEDLVLCVESNEVFLSTLRTGDEEYQTQTMDRRRN
jgi:hypothetical protein